MSTVTDDIAKPTVSTEGGSPTDGRMENAVPHGQHQDIGAEPGATSEVTGGGDRRVPGVSTGHGDGARPGITDDELRSMISNEWPMHIRHSASCALYADGITSEESAQQRKQCAEVFVARKRADAVRKLHCINCHDIIKGGPKVVPCTCRCHRSPPMTRTSDGPEGAAGAEGGGVTAESLTDEQIQRLLVDWGSMAIYCRNAYGPRPKSVGQRVIWGNARARIASAINARNGAKP